MNVQGITAAEVAANKRASDFSDRKRPVKTFSRQRGGCSPASSSVFAAAAACSRSFSMRRTRSSSSISFGSRSSASAASFSNSTAVVFDAAAARFAFSSVAGITTTTASSETRGGATYGAGFAGAGSRRGDLTRSRFVITLAGFPVAACAFAARAAATSGETFRTLSTRFASFVACARAAAAQATISEQM